MYGQGEIQLGQATGCQSVWIPAEHTPGTFNFQEISFGGNQVKTHTTIKNKTLENIGSTHQQETFNQVSSLYPQKQPFPVKSLPLEERHWEHLQQKIQTQELGASNNPGGIRKTTGKGRFLAAPWETNQND